MSALFLAAQSENISLRPKNNSPLSRFGLGDLFDQPLAAAAGMGGLSAAYNEPFHINLLNPASLPHLQSTAFEVGMYSKYARLKDGETSDNIWSVDLQAIWQGPSSRETGYTLDRFCLVREAPVRIIRGLEKPLDLFTPYQMDCQPIQSSLAGVQVEPVKVTLPTGNLDQWWSRWVKRTVPQMPQMPQMPQVPQMPQRAP